MLVVENANINKDEGLSIKFSSDVVIRIYDIGIQNYQGGLSLDINGSVLEHITLLEDEEKVNELHKQASYC